MGREFRYLHINERLAEINGFPPGDHLGRTTEEMIPDLWPTLGPIYRRVRDTGEAVTDVDVSGQVASTPGEERHWLAGFYPVHSHDGLPIGIGVMAVEITERRRAEAELRLRERRYRSFVEASAGVVWTADVQGRGTSLNGTWVELTGLPQEAGYGNGWLDFVHPGDRSRAAAEWAEAVGTGRVYDSRFRGRRADGHWRHMHGRAVPVRDEAGRVEEWVGVTTDETDGVLAERRFQAMLENSSDVISIHDPPGRMVYQSPSIKPVMGYDEGELLDRNVLDYIHPDDVGFTAERITQVKARPGTQPPFVIRFRHKNGEWRWCECVGTNLLDHPAVGGILFNARDVTDRIRAEGELRRSERRYRTLVSATSKLIWTATPTGEIVPPEEEVTFSGRPREEAVGWGWLDIVHPDDRVRAERQWREAVSAGQPLASEVRIRRADGAWRRIAAQMIPIRDGGGKIEEWVGVGEDVTDLRHVETWLRAVLDSTFDAIITLDEQGVIVSANASAHRKFDYPQGELVGRPITVLMPDPYQDRHSNAVSKYLRSGQAKIIGIVQELVGRRRDGSTFPIELAVTEFRANEARHFTGVIRDISTTAHV